MVRFLLWIWHKLCGHTRQQCECGGMWRRWEGVNPIHVDGPPLWFVGYCCQCGKSTTRSSGLMEEAAYRQVAAGMISEDKAADILTKILPPKVIVDTYGEE
jgi:hypothetical protein